MEFHFELNLLYVIVGMIVVIISIIGAYIISKLNPLIMLWIASFSRGYSFLILGASELL